MKYVPIFLFLFLCACGKSQVKPAIHEDSDFYFADVLSGIKTTYDHQIDLRIMVSQGREFSSRYEQINWALDVTDYSLNLELSDVDFVKLPPSPYLSFNKLITIKHYLRLSGFSGQKIIIDSTNKSIIYLKKDHPFFNDHSYFIDPVKDISSDTFDNVSTNESPVIEIFNNDDSSIVKPIVIQTYEPEISAPNEVVLLLGADDLNVHENTPSLIELNNESDDSLDISVNLDTVIEKTEPNIFSVKNNHSLRDIFSQMSDFYGLDFISSLGRHDWFLNSTINHDFEFIDLDHALSLILSESNQILAKNNLDFLIKASINNGLLDIYYE